MPQPTLLPAPAPEAAVHELWDELADFGPAAGDAALLHLLRRTAALVDAQNAWWMAVVRVGGDCRSDPYDSWRPGAIRYLHETPTDRDFYGEAEKLVHRRQVDESVQANVRGAGTFRVNWLPEMVSPEWFESPFYRYAYEARDIRDAVFVCCPVNRDAEAILGYHRKGADAGPFTAEERALLAHAVRGLRWLHRWLVLERGLLVASEPLTESERRVLRLLLAGSSETAAAKALRLARSTTHNHVTRIFRKYGVSSRAQLMSLWLGGAAGAPAHPRAPAV